MFRDHQGFQITQLPDATPSKMKHRRQRIRKVRRRAITYNPNRHEEMIWLRG